jgi:hypothetical protein
MTMTVLSTLSRVESRYFKLTQRLSAGPRNKHPKLSAAAAFLRLVDYVRAKSRSVTRWPLTAAEVFACWNT